MPLPELGLQGLLGVVASGREERMVFLLQFDGVAANEQAVEQPRLVLGQAGRVVASLVDPLLVGAEESAVFFDQPDIALHSERDQRGGNGSVVEAALQYVAKRGGGEVVGG